MNEMMTKRVLKRPEKNVLSPLYFIINCSDSSVEIWQKQALLKDKISHSLSKIYHIPIRDFLNLSLEVLLEMFFENSFVDESAKLLVRQYDGVLYKSLTSSKNF